MKHLILLMLICVGMLLNAQPAWDEDTLIVESHYQYWWDSVSGDEVLYYTWAEETEAGFVIKTQGVGVDQSNIWVEPVCQDINIGFPREIKVSLGDDGSLFLYWTNYVVADTLSGYLQKISSEGELLWGADGTEIEFFTYQLEFLSDNAGGLYCHSQYGNLVYFWHFDASGEIVAGWENGIILGERELEYIVTSSGELAVFKQVTEIDVRSRYFQMVGTDGSYLYPGEGIYCGLCDTDSGGILSLDDNEYMLAWVTEGSVRGNKLLNNGELLYPASISLGEHGDGEHFQEISYQNNTCYLCLNDRDQEIFRVIQFDETWQMVVSGVDFAYEGNLVYSQIKPEGNIMLVEREQYWNRLIEYNEAGVLLSPPEGWLYFNAEYEYNISSDGLGDTYITREIIDEKGQSDFKGQIYNPQSEAIFADEGFLICENKQLRSRNCQIIALSEKIAYCWYELSEGKITYKVQYLDMEGIPLLEHEGLEILSRGGSYGEYRVLLKEENSLLLLEYIRESLTDNYTRIHRIILDDEPWLEWGEAGIEIAGMNRNDVEAVKREDNSYLLHWRNGLEGSRGQLIVDGEQMLPEDYDLGLNDGTIISIMGDYCTFSSGYDIYLTRWNNWLASEWLSPVWLTGRNYFEANSFDHIAEGNLVKYWISYEGDQMQNFCWYLKKQIITPEGEKLLGTYADVIYEDAELEIRDFCYIEELDQIILICSESSYFMKYMSMAGEILSTEYFSFADLGDRGVLELFSEHGYLLVKTGLKRDTGTEMGICVFDFEGNAIQDLPGPDFFIPDNYFSEIIADERGIYYAWAEMHANESYYLTNHGKDIYAQKIDFPANEIEEVQLPKVTSILKTYPNPFNPSVKIRWQLAEIDEDSKLAVFNIKGQKVREYNVNSKAGHVTWDGKDTSQQQCASGVYLLRLKNGLEEKAAKVLMLK
jgi:Secretion system C-terminal sorting domain